MSIADDPSTAVFDLPSNEDGLKPSFLAGTAERGRSS
jgi:hypothetical protein